MCIVAMTITTQVQFERKGELINQGVMKGIIEMLDVLGGACGGGHAAKSKVYVAMFERDFLENSRSYYQEYASMQLGLGASGSSGLS